MKHTPQIDEDSQSDLIKKNERINHTQDGLQTHSATANQEKKKKVIKWAIIGAIILLIVILAIVLPIVLSKGGDNPTPVNPGYDKPYNIYDASTVSTSAYGYSGYITASSKYSQQLHEDALQSLFTKLQSNSSGLKLGVHSSGIPQGKNNEFFTNLSFSMMMHTYKVAHFRLTNAKDANRYEIPEQAVPKPGDDQSMRLDMLGFSMNNKNFSFTFSDPVTNDVFITTKDSTLVFMDKYIQMDFILPSQRMFGFGERIREFQLGEGTWTMWAIGQNSPYDDGSGRLGVYGVHPFILIQTKKKNDFIGMFFRNSNFQSPVIRYNEDGTSTLSYISTGGIIDVYFFIHGTAKSIISQYQQAFGTPRLPPYWSLGWQQASFAWTNQTMVEYVLGNFTANNMPLDTVYLDIPYMDNFVDFTVDTKNFPNLTGLAKQLHNNNQSLVVIIDAAISAENTSNEYYSLGNSDGVFIKSGLYNSAKYNGNLISQVWPKQCVFVDWFHPQSTNVWSKGLNDLYAQTLFDGIWIDMNEPTTFVHGEIKPADVKAEEVMLEEEFTQPSQLRESRFLLQEEQTVDFKWYHSFTQSEISTFNLPFVPQYDRPRTGNFDNWTLSLNATHPGLNGETEYNVHSLYGLMMAKRTHEYLTSNESYPGKDNRPFILSRSTFASAGRYASHWLGDNFRQWKYLRYSIAGIMNMNMFGIPQVGSDVCGFFGKERDDELCARWSQLAAFYPLARFHYDNESMPNEPYLMNGTNLEITKRAMHDRYQTLRHMYTCLFEAHKNGGSCFDPLFYYFPSDDKVYEDIESTFVVGGALKVTPILKSLLSNETTMPVYFPNGTWVNIYNNAEIIEGGKTVNLSTTGLHTNVHLMPGSLISFQDNSDMTVMNVASLKKKGIQLLVNRDKNGYAYGSLFLDGGLSLSELDNGEYEYYQFYHQSNTINSLKSEDSKGTQNYALESIKILNAADLEDVSVACYLTKNKEVKPMTVKYTGDGKTLTITADQETPFYFHDFHSIHYSRSDEVSICNTDSFSYTIADGIIPSLSGITNLTLNLSHSAGTLPNIQIQFRLLSSGIVNVKWTWAKDSQGKWPSGKRVPFELPDDLVSTNNLTESTTDSLSKYVSITNSPSFKFNILNKDGASTVFSLNGMLYDEYLNWINVRIYTESGDKFKGIFGLGERANQDFFYKDGVYGMHTRDAATPDETGTLPGANMYGVHPFFMYKFTTDSWVGVYYKLAHAQDWWVKNNATLGTVDLSTITIGGVADIYIMIGKKPDTVVSMLYTLIGNPVMIPQWALGWNQCRWGYQNLTIVKEVVSNYASNDLPLDVQWSDIDYLNMYRNFEYDEVNFAGLPEFVKDLHDKNMKWVPIIDAGLAYRPDDYPAFQDGQKKDLFMKINNETFIGEVWPNDAAFPDFFHPDISSWWKSYLTSLHNTVAFDGLWEDMNEASNFCNGICYTKQQVASPIKNKLKYIPTGRDLEYKSMPLDAKHYNGAQQVDTHSLFGIQEIKVTNEWFQSQNKRTMIIERSSITGLGKWASRWLGDNWSTEQQMAYSVSGVMLMNMFGITLAGADICGFIGDTNPELCTKWHVLGSFYPFSRNHNNWGQKSQEPWVFKDYNFDGQNALDVMRESIKRKYSLIRYYYTNLFQISAEGTGSFFKPMFFEFPDDYNTYSDIIYNVMLGSALKLSINPQNLTMIKKDYYFPAGLWCGVSGTLTVGECFTSVGQNQTYDSNITDYQLHIRQGYIVPMQDTSSKTFSTSKDIQDWFVDFHVLGETVTSSTTWNAIGTYINDDGTTMNYTGQYNKYTLSSKWTSNSFTFSVSTDVKSTAKLFRDEANCTAVNNNDILKNIYYYNAQGYTLTSDMNVNAVYLNETSIQIGKATYNSTSNQLVFTADDGKEPCLSTLKELQFTASQ